MKKAIITDVTLRADAENGEKLSFKEKTYTGKKMSLVCDLTQRQMDIVTAGGLLNYTREGGK